MDATRPPATGLLGRTRELERLEDLLAGVRAGESRALVLRGEAGVGKTALLERLVARAEGCTVVRASGVESEMELAFAVLHALCAPMLGRLTRLPEPQRGALSRAFGLDAGPPPDRFMVGLAVLSLLADAAEEQPLLCVIDDVQWLDRVSAQTLAFVARRLLAEGVGLVFAVRGNDEDAALHGLAELTVEGLDPEDAQVLLERSLPGRLDAEVRERILAEASGNPLGLLELPRGLQPTAIAGALGLPDSAPLTSRLEQTFARQVEALPSSTRQLLLLAAAEPLGDVPLLRRAGDALGLGAQHAADAEDSGLLRIGRRTRFRHPLVRSAVYRGASPSERRAVHRALAEATDAGSDPDRRAWHRAQAAEQLDEAVAEELERSAGRARGRGGVASAAAFLARAAELTPDPRRRGERAMMAAAAQFEAGALRAADDLVALAETCPLDDLQRARLSRLRARNAFALRRGSDAPPLFLAAAKQLEALDPAAARESYLEALDAALVVGGDGGAGVRVAAEAARAAPAATGAPRPIDLLLDGMATRFTEGPEAGVPVLKAAVRAFHDEVPDGPEAIMQWLSHVQAVLPMAVFELWDDEALWALPTRAVGLARQAGALTMLPIGLAYLGGAHLFGGDLVAASTAGEELNGIRAATGHVVVGAIGLFAWRAEADASERINAAYVEATARGEGRVVSMAGCCAAILNNGLAQYDAAIDGALRGSDEDDQWYVGWSLAELVEAASRAGRPDLVAPALRRLERRTRAAGTDWALGVLARSRALTLGGDAAEASYREAIERLERTRTRTELFRAHLLYGEWLRREQRRRDAREHLRTAYDAFSAMGAAAFAERARRELTLTGETVIKRTAATRDVLTAQEAQIARMARDGESNPEIGAQLFISPRTVEYHLRKVFSKLGINSRKALRTALRDEDSAVSG